MVAREVGVDDALRARLVSVAARSSPRFGRLLAQEPSHSLAIEFILAPEMSVEAAGGEPGIVHDLADRDVGKSLAVEQAPRALKDSLAGLLLVLGRIGHMSSIARPAI